MNDRSLFLIVAMVFALGVRAQELTVKEMKSAPMDLSASQYERKDLTNKPCGLVKVQLATTGAQFEGNVIGKAEYKTGEYWVYMSEGSYMLNVKHPNFVPLSVNFRDYGINGVKGKTTYILTLLMPQANIPIQVQKLIINYTPDNAIVLVDSKPCKGNGRVELSLPIGNHNYIIAADGYESAEGSVKLTAAAPRTVTEVLVPSSQPVQEPTPIVQSSPTSSQPYTELQQQPKDSQQEENAELLMERLKAQVSAVDNAQVDSYTDTNGRKGVRATFECSILFSTGSSKLSSAGRTSLTQFADVLKLNTGCDVTVCGYTDNSDWKNSTREQSSRKNQDLSQKRAMAVISYLWSVGVRPSQISSTIGFGESFPVADNSTAAGMAKNRRVEIILYNSPPTTQMDEGGNTTNKVEPIRRDFFFEPNKWEILEKEKEKLKDLADYKHAHPKSRFILTGYAAIKSDTKANKDKLSINRAKAIRDTLIKDFGIDNNSILFEAKGEIVQPFSDDNNNRVVIVIGE